MPARIRVAAEVVHVARVSPIEPVAEAIEAICLGGAGDSGQLESHRAGIHLQPVLNLLAQCAIPPRKRCTAFRPAAQSWENTFLIFPSSASACKHRKRATDLPLPRRVTILRSSSSLTPHTFPSAVQQGTMSSTSGKDSPAADTASAMLRSFGRAPFAQSYGGDHSIAGVSKSTWVRTTRTGGKRKCGRSLNHCRNRAKKSASALRAGLRAWVTRRTRSDA